MYGCYYNGMTYYFETQEQLDQFIKDYVEVDNPSKS
jgi:YHS domain-containing protein